MTPEQILESLKAQLRGNIRGYEMGRLLCHDQETYVIANVRKEENENILLSIEKMEQIEVE